MRVYLHACVYTPADEPMKKHRCFSMKNAPIIDVAEITETDNVVPVDREERRCCHNWAERQMVREMIG